jgi:small-conductance mechanosensitive channel
MGDYLLHKFDVARALALSNSLLDWLIAGIVAIAVWSGLWILRRFAATYFAKHSAARHRTPIKLIAYLIGNTRQIFFIALALFAAHISLTLPEKVQHSVANIVLVFILLQVGLWAGRAVRFYLETSQPQLGGDQVFAGSLDIIRFVAGILIWSLVILVALENLGINITALLAGLGVGGVAVALALQNVLGDLFASLSIALDKPFAVGDTLTIDTFNGTVERIGIKTTRLRSDTGEQIIVSNADMLKSRVRNFGRAQEQRVLTTLRVSYATSADTLRSIPPLLEGIVRDQAHVRFERCHLKTLGESSLQFELSYFVQQPNFNSVLDVQQAVNFHIVDAFRHAAVEFEYPTQRLIVAPPAGAGEN